VIRWIENVAPAIRVEPLVSVSEQRFAGVLRDGTARFVAEANEVVPTGRLVGGWRIAGWCRRSVRKDWWRKRDRDVSGAWKICAVA